MEMNEGNIENEEILRGIKHSFMVYRNGIVADTLRQAGMPYKIIFGLQLPQLSEIARRNTPSIDIADRLWADRHVRESRLLACYLYPREVITEEKALALAEDVQTAEEADILCFRLLRYLPFVSQLAERLAQSGEPLTAYCATALRRNLDAMA